MPREFGKSEKFLFNIIIASRYVLHLPSVSGFQTFRLGREPWDFSVGDTSVIKPIRMNIRALAIMQCCMNCKWKSDCSLLFLVLLSLSVARKDIHFLHGI